MTTSGTVAQTSFDTAKVLEHAFRRCGIPAAKQTAEVVGIAQENLYLLLTALGSRGLNLWCVQTQFVGLASGQAQYYTPSGTIDVLNVVYSTPTRTTGTDTTAAASVTTALTSSTTVTRIGVKCSVLQASDTLTISGYDGSSWTVLITATKTDWTADTWYWFDVPKTASYSSYRAVFTTGPATFDEFYLATAVSDLPVIQWSRDTWSTINTKAVTGHPSTNYYFEKLLTPRLTLWPVPDTDYNHLTLFIHRQVEDVGTMVQTLAIPNRWFEPVVWQLSARLVFEVAGVPQDVKQDVVSMSEKYLLEVEDEEQDGAPLYITPNIGVYR